MTRDEFTAVLKLAVLGLASRFDKTFESDQALDEFVDDLMHGYSTGKLMNIPIALADIRRNGYVTVVGGREQRVQFFPRCGDVRAMVDKMPVDQQYMDAQYERFTRRVLEQADKTPRLRSVTDLERQQMIAEVKALTGHAAKELSACKGPEWESRLRQQADDLKRQLVASDESRES